MARFLTEEQQARQKEYVDLRTKVQGLREKVEPIKHERRMNRLMAEADKLTHFLERNAPDKLPEPINPVTPLRKSVVCPGCCGNFGKQTYNGMLYCSACYSRISGLNLAPINAPTDEKKPLAIAPAVAEPIKWFDGPPGRDYRISSIEENHPINRTEECKCNRIDCNECFDRFDNTM